MCKRGRLRYLCLALALAGCEPSQADYERAENDAVLSGLHVTALRREIPGLESRCATWRPASASDTAPEVCHQLRAAMAELDTAIFDSVRAAAKLRRFGQ